MQAPRLTLSLCALALFGAAQAPLAARETARAAGLAAAGDWRLVRANCTKCHSASLITQNSGSRGVWQIRLATMRQTHGMDALDAEVEERILDYLAEHYGQRQASRRAPLAPHLMPENPLSQL